MDKMYSDNYNNFVRARLSEQCAKITENKLSILSGEEAKNLYLEEINDDMSSFCPRVIERHELRKEKKSAHTNEEIPLTNNYLFMYVQNNDVIKLKCALDRYPEKINILDDYGWSLLMIACQANSIDTTKELLKRGIKTSIRDKAGNSAQSLVIKNKNYVLADILLKHKKNDNQPSLTSEKYKPQSTEIYMCDICYKRFPDREEHLSSIVHNICASKGKKIPVHYAIPVSNKGYQIMLKGGWDRESGLGRGGSGKIYPIKTVQKKDRKGLGHIKKNCTKKAHENNVNSKKMFTNSFMRNRNFEINFRREFY